MRVWVLVRWEADVASDTVGVFASRERAEAHARGEAGRELAWRDEKAPEGRSFRFAETTLGAGYALEEFEVVE
jgi:hypothetical protein